MATTAGPAPGFKRSVPIIAGTVLLSLLGLTYRLTGDREAAGSTPVTVAATIDAATPTAPSLQQDYATRHVPATVGRVGERADFGHPPVTRPRLDSNEDFGLRHQPLSAVQQSESDYINLQRRKMVFHE